MEPSLVDIGRTFDEEIMEAVKVKIAEFMDKTVDEIESDYQIVRLHPLTLLIENNYFDDTVPCRIFSIEELKSNETNLFIGNTSKLSDAESSLRDIDGFVKSIVPTNDDNTEILVKTSIIKMLREDKRAVSYTNQYMEAISVMPNNSNLLRQELEFLGNDYGIVREWLVENNLIKSDVI